MTQLTDIKFAQWANKSASIGEGVNFLLDGGELPESLKHISVLLTQGGEARAEELLRLGAARVLLADAAVLDSAVIARLSQQYGSERIGVYVMASKMGVSWTLDTVSNEDFNCLTPSYCKAAWEVLLSDGGGTGADVEWWLAEMFKLGASTALVAMDMQDDDLNICAGLIESYGEKLWFTPRQQLDADLEPWVRYGQVRQLLLPALPKYDAAEKLRIAQSIVVVANEVKVEEGQGVAV